VASPTQALNDYISALNQKFSAGNATEHSYRPALQALLEILSDAKANHIQVTNEPKRIDCGAPDYSVTKSELPLGHLEAKDIPINLADRSLQSQFDRYKKALSNLIITNYLTFELYRDGSLVAKAAIGKVKGKAIIPDKTQYDAFLEIITTFIGYEGKTITDSDTLAVMMSDKARILAKVIAEELHKSKEKESNAFIETQFNMFKSALIHTMTESEFADMFSQTLTYGLFAAKMNDRSGKTFDRLQAANSIPQSNLFLRKFFQRIGAFDLDERIAYIVDSLVNVFNTVSVEDLLKEFEKSGQDPFLHFYETFLSRYSPTLREKRGVYYTPLPIVRFIINSVDTLLKNDFNMKDGLADKSTVKRNTDDYSKVFILEPATGTGTFLVEAVDKMYRHYENNKALWEDFCTKYLIPRINGFEILMAPYAMAHFKLDMKLKETGIDVTTLNDRFHIYLTNSLEKPIDKTGLIFDPYLAEEAKEADKIKTDAPVMVVIGNPPYSGESANKESLNDLLEDYKKEPGGVEKLSERNSKWLNDDYVKFIRYGQQLVTKNESGILAYVNNHSYLDNPTFRGMRWNLLKSFDKIYILNLHGNVKRQEKTPDGSKDENMFNIMQGVCINIFVKTGKQKTNALADVYYADAYGVREYKSQYLLENCIETIKWQKLEPDAPQYYFVAKNFTGKEEYEKGFSVQDLFQTNGMGITTAHDDFVIDESRDVIEDRFIAFKDTPEYPAQLHAEFNVKEKEGWNIIDGHKNIQGKKIGDYIKSLNYRLFDERYIFYEDKLLWRPVKKIMQHLSHNDNLALCCCSFLSQSTFAHVFITNRMIDNCYLSNKTKERTYAFPLYLYPEEGTLDTAETRRPNLGMAIVNQIAATTGLHFTPEKDDTDSDHTFAPIDLLDYIYAVLYSNHYRKTYSEFLKIDFPRVPYPENAGQFKKLTALGSSLRQLHLLENVLPSATYAGWTVKGSNQIEQSEYKAGSVYINKEQYFANVPEAVWTYQIGGYQPAQKWLKDRKGRILDIDTIEHYQKIITALTLTIDLQEQIDEVLTI
jgi:predicted helicase